MKRLLVLMMLSPLCLMGQTTYLYVSDAGNFDTPPWQIMKYNLDASELVEGTYLLHLVQGGKSKAVRKINISHSK